MRRIAIYPGSFDPVTNGHINLIERASRHFDKVIVAVARASQKKPLFTFEERIEMLEEVTREIDGVEVDSFDGLLVDYVRKKGARVVLRGLRAVSDFEYEFQMAHMNHKLFEEMETFFMVTGAEEFFISSNLVKEIARLQGCVKGLVPECVREKLAERFGKGRE
jgi:pantetheine-phosphate adenylyltransferase